MRGRLLASNATVTARTFVATGRSPKDRYFDVESPQFACACLKFLEISQNLSKWPIPTRHTFKRTKALKIVPIGEILMQFALLIYELPEAFAARKSDGTDIDLVRHQQVALASEPTLQLLREEREMTLAAEFPDDRLKLLFVCAHPAIDSSMHTPLMLQTVLGLDAARIAHAFLVSPATMGQRLVRAKTKI